MDEFSLIERYFHAIGRFSPATRLGIGDDAAVVAPRAGRQLVVAMDTLVAGTHFGDDASAADIGYKALTVNLSDLAAMGAEPEWFLLSLTLPDADPDWLAEFAAGLRQAAREGPQLIGGDTCRGPLTITVQIAGSVPDDLFVTRAGARPGDLVVVSGELGNAALGLSISRDGTTVPAVLRAKAVAALHRPRARLELLEFLRYEASAAIDISDGLIGDLRHVLERSGCGAVLDRNSLPVDDWIRQQDAWRYPLGGGDDYEICLCLPEERRSALEHWNARHTDCPLTEIGVITEQGYQLRCPGETLDLAEQRAWRHFV